MTHEEHVRNCPECHKMMSMGAGIRLLEHLQRSHRVDDQVALKIVNWVFGKIAEVREKILHSTNHAQR